VEGEAAAGGREGSAGVMARKRKRPGGCIRCGRQLKNPSPSGMGPSCEKKHAAAMAARERREAEGQLRLDEILDWITERRRG